MKLNYNTPKKQVKIPEKKFKIPEIRFNVPSFRLSWIHLVAVIAIFMWWQSSSEANDLKDELVNFNEVKKDSIKYYKTKLGEEVATKLAYKGSKETLEILLSDSKDSTDQWKRLAKKYKKVNAATKTETITRIDTVKIPYNVPGVEFNVSFNLSEPYYTINGRSTNLGLYLDLIEIPNTQSIVIGEKKKKGLFSFKTETRIDVINSNPFVKTINIDGYTLKQRRKRIGLGVYVGYGFNSFGISPQIGIGVHYSLISF